MSLLNANTRSKAYAYTLLGCVLAIALIGLVGIWGFASFDSTLYKFIASFVAVGALSGFLYTLNAGTDKKLSQRLVYVVGGSAVIGTILVLLQTWTGILDDALFAKALSSLVVIGLLAAFVMAMFDDFFENKKLKDENYLD